MCIGGREILHAGRKLVEHGASVEVILASKTPTSKESKNGKFNNQ